MVDEGKLEPCWGVGASSAYKRQVASRQAPASKAMGQHNAKCTAFILFYEVSFFLAYQSF